MLIIVINVNTSVPYVAYVSGSEPRKVPYSQHTFFYLQMLRNVSFSHSGWSIVCYVRRRNLNLCVSLA